MEKNIHKLRVNFHDSMNDARAIDVLIESDLFASLYEASTEEELERLDDILLHSSKFKFTDWMERHSSLPLEEWTVRNLQSLASRYLIPNYSRMVKVDLVVAVRREQETRKEKRGKNIE